MAGLYLLLMGAFSSLYCYTQESPWRGSSHLREKVSVRFHPA